jgi:hypothetical protein
VQLLRALLVPLGLVDLAFLCGGSGRSRSSHT